MPTVADLLVVEVQVNTGGSAQAVNALSRELQGIGGSSQQATQATSSLSSVMSLQNQNALRLGASLLGLGIGLSAVTTIGREVHQVFADILDTSTRFGASMAEVSAVSGATSEQLQRLGSLARAGGVDIGIGGNEAARGLVELTKGGVSVEAALGGALRATELMAKAGGVDLAQAAEISAVAMNSFGLSAAQLPHVADLVSAAANASSIDVNDFRQSLTQAGAVARTVGVSFDDTSVAIAELGQAGLKGSDAGTSLRTFLLRLTPESKQAEDAMRSLGIITADGSNKFFDATGKARGLSEISAILKTSLTGYTDQQKIATLQTIFGTDAIRAASIFAREGATGFDTLRAAMAKVGAEKVAQERLNSLAGDMEKLNAQTERFKLAFGEALVGPGRPAVQAATRSAQQTADITESAGLGGFILQALQSDITGVGAITRPLLQRIQAEATAKREAAEASAAIQQQIVAPGLANETAGGLAGALAVTTEETNKLLKPARELRAELDALAASGKGAAQGVNTLEAATAGLRLAGEGDLEAVASLKAEAALRLREQAVGERLASTQFRQRLVTGAADTALSADDRAKANERLRFFDQERAAQLELVRISQQQANAERAVKTEQDLQRQASLALEIQQLPGQSAALQNKIEGLQLDQQAAPLRSQLLVIEQQIAAVTNQRLSLERELAVLVERQRSAPGRAALEDNQTRIRELQLELQTRDPSLDRGAIRREIRGLQRAAPGLELDVLHSDVAIRAIERQQAATKLADDITINGLNQQKVAIQGQLTPLQQRKQLTDDAAATIARQLEIEKASFEQGQAGSRGRLLRAQQIAGALGLSASAQQEAIAALGLPAEIQGPPIPAGLGGPNGPPISVTIQNNGDMNVRNDADIQAILTGQQQMVLDAIASVLDHAAADATPPADVNLNGARRPLGQPQG